MKLHTKKKQHGDYWETFCEVAEVEIDPVRVYFDSSPAEEDVNWAGDLEMRSVEHNGRDVLPDMSPSEEDHLLERLREYLVFCEDDGLGDYLYDQKKDAKAEERSK